MDFHKILIEAEKNLVQGFKIKIQNETSMNRNKFLKLFLATFLGEQYFDELDSDNFNDICHDVIDSISLCGEEIYFFHEIVNLHDTHDYVAECINKYQSINNLDKCQLGGSILKCLKASSHLKIL
ncbi:hypothetical protein [Acanthamoeba polyphaga mimivirus]|nr:hypothetical protein [Acanthamoeba castellanii mamavirus]AHA45000.1 hypothetical protein HIRU_S94 [Hirudovirus strain Sangsue]EJN40584.1 hypothetical protein lvs_R726 [Acanthamoeba polyphaga lentillevirus]QTF49769.1 hypothetical protein [Mimivirus reunion]UMZ07619.1 hypothetical protein [Acanthamoeba polyphaga mimivirus]WMV62212.1 hypothetical protein qu_878 [Mimivirus sp.]